MAIDSVPPSISMSAKEANLSMAFQLLTGKRGRYEDRGKTADTADEWGARDVPVFSANVTSLRVAAAVDNDTHDDEDLKESQMNLRLIQKYRNCYLQRW